MQESQEDGKKRLQELEGEEFKERKNAKSKKFKEKVSIGNDLAKEDVLVKKKEEEKKARKRTRGPYRKSSRAGL